MFSIKSQKMKLHSKWSHFSEVSRTVADDGPPTAHQRSINGPALEMEMVFPAVSCQVVCEKNTVALISDNKLQMF